MKSAWVNKGDILLKYFLSVFIYSVLSIFVMLNLRMLLSWKINDRKFRRNRHEKGFGKIWMNLAQRNGKLCMNRLLFWLNVVLSFVLVMFSFLLGFYLHIWKISIILRRLNGTGVLSGKYFIKHFLTNHWQFQFQSFEIWA